MGKIFARGLLLSLAMLGSQFALACIPDSQTLCLKNGRFQVTVDWEDQAGNPKTIPDTNRSGSGTAHTLAEDTGTFWFAEDQHHELLVKVLEGCSINNRFWVFVTGATNMGYTLTVTDTDAGVTQQYLNPVLNTSVPITDTSAFNTCATPTTTTANPASPPLPIAFDPGEAGTCVSDAQTLCLFSNRFAVQVQWDSPPLTGNGTAVPLTNETGLFWFFSANNLEHLISVYDGRAINGHFWIFSAGLTNVGYDLVVTDTITNETFAVNNLLGIPAPTVLYTGPAAPPPPLPPQEVPGLSLQAMAALSLLTLLLMGWRQRRFKV